MWKQQKNKTKHQTLDIYEQANKERGSWTVTFDL